MDSFEITVKKETYKIAPNLPEGDTFSVFNYAMCHVIRRDVAGNWEAVKHRFGAEYLPIKEIGAAIDRYIAKRLRS